MSLVTSLEYTLFLYQEWKVEVEHKWNILVIARENARSLAAVRVEVPNRFSYLGTREGGDSSSPVAPMADDHLRPGIPRQVHLRLRSQYP